MDDLNRVATFVRVVDSGSFTAAAAALGVPKSTVSRAVAALEAELGVRLLHRTTRKLGLTDAGRTLFERARGAIDGVEEAAEAAASLGKEPRGVVRLTAPPGIGDELARVVGLFARRHPHVRFEVLLTGRRVDLVEEGFDLALRGGRLDDSSLVARAIPDPGLAPHAAPAYLRERGRPARVADLADHACLLYRTRGGRGRWPLHGPGGVEEVEVRGPVEADEMDFLVSCALGGLGIALLPIRTCRRHVEAGALERILAGYALGAGSLHVVWPHRAFEPAAVARFRDELIAALGAPPA